jgi:hypothetical protein
MNGTNAHDVSFGVMRTALTLCVEPGSFAVCQVRPHEAIPDWGTKSAFFSVTRTAEELSIVCTDRGDIPETVRSERGWRMLRVAGTQPFTATGVLSSILDPLADAAIGIFAISTFDTDYVLVKSANFERAIAILKGAGHSIESQ